MNEARPPDEGAGTAGRWEHAEEIYAAFRAAAEEGGSAELGALCQQHPELAEELRALHSRWMEVAAALGSSRPASSVPGRPTVSAAVLARLFAEGQADRRYRTGEIHARGGMAVIRLARDRQLDRTVAMKVLEQKGRGDERVLRFLAEARITGQLQHPSVVPVHDLGLDAEGQPYFTMELVRGQTLGAILPEARNERGGWSLARAVRVLVQVCEAVAYAHSHHVVHRDLKPANVMVGSFGEVMVMDWGLAKVLPGAEIHDVRPLPGESVVESGSSSWIPEQHPGSTREGDVLGTPCYMAPEQAAGDPEAVGPAADVYAGGAILYELLTGTRPYLDRPDVTAMEVLERLRREAPVPVAELCPAAPPELVAICTRAMARDPGARYPDMQAMARDLEAWLDGRVVQAYRTGLLVELRKWIQRNRALSGAIAVAVFALLGALVAFGVVQNRAARALEWQNYLANLVAAEAALRGPDTAAAAEALESVATRFQDRWEWRHLHGPRLDQALAVLPSHGDPGVRQVLPAPGGRIVATASWDGTVRLWRAADWSPRGVLQHRGQVLAIAFDAGGERLASGSYDRFARLWSVADGTLLWQSPPHPREVSAVALSPDGELLATGCYDGGVRLFHLPGGTPGPTLPGHRGPVYQVLFRQGGAGLELITASWDGTVRIIPLEGGEPRVLGRLGAGQFWCAALGAGDRLLAAAGDRRVIHVWDLDDPAKAWTVAEAHSARITGLAFAPGASRLASCSWDGTIRLWDLPGGEGPLRPRALLAGHRGWVWSVAFASDVRLLSGSPDGTVRRWDGAAVGGPVPRLTDPGGQSLYSAVAGAGVRAAGTQDGRVLLWQDGTTGAPRSWRAHPGQRTLDLHLDPEGRRLLTVGDRDDAAVWELPDGRELLRFRHGNPVDATLRGRVAPDPSWTRLAHGRPDGSVQVRSLADGAVLAALEGQKAQVLACAWSPDGRWIASGAVDGSALLHEASGASPPVPLLGHQGPVIDLAFDGEGRRLATGCWDTRVRIFSVPDGRLLHELEGHTGWVSYVAWRPGGPPLASASVDGTVRLWDPDRGEPLLALHGHQDVVSALAWTPSGGALLSSSLDQTLREWSAIHAGNWQAR